MFGTFECGLIGIRGKEDPWNSIVAGALTGGALSIRMGIKAAGKSAAIGVCSCSHDLRHKFSWRFKCKIDIFVRCTSFYAIRF